MRKKGGEQRRERVTGKKERKSTGSKDIVREGYIKITFSETFRKG